jgi:hypothetical protein
LTGTVGQHTLVAMPRAALRALLALPLLVACRRTHVPPDVTVPGPPRLAAPPPAPPSAPPRAWEPPPLAAPPAAPRPAARDDELTLTNSHVIGADGGGMPDGGTANGDPRGPRLAVLDEVVRSALPAVQGCFDQVPGVVPGVELAAQVSYQVLPTGRTAGVDVNGSLPAATLSCIRRVVEDLKFPSFEGPEVRGRFPFKYHREPQQR